jgi:hypothetical protein
MIGRARAIKGFVADPLIEPIANPALAMKEISDTTLHKIIAAMVALIRLAASFKEVADIRHLGGVDTSLLS